MIQIIPTTLSGTTPSLYGVIIDENVCCGYDTNNMPTAVVTVVNNGGVVSSGGVTMQKLTFAVTITYQPCDMRSETKVKTYAESVTVSLPGTVTTVTPAIGSTVNIQPTRYMCGSKAMGVRLQTSVSVAYA